VSVELFRDDDQGYAAWLAANAQGYVLNIQRTLNPSDARVHHADCRTITGTPPRGRTWTGPYVKACSLSLPELDAWALAQAGSAITRCGTCQWLPRAAIRPPAPAQCAENSCRRHGADTLHSADSVAASDHDRRPCVVSLPILAQRWHGATRALAAAGCSTGSLSSSASTTIPPLPSRSTPSPPTCCTSWRRVCPCARSGQYPRAGAARPGGPDPAPAWGHLGRGRPAPVWDSSRTP
jgi:hypothetical protein